MKGKTTATEIGDALYAHCEKIQIDSPHPSLTHPDRYCAARRQGPRRRPATHKQFHPFYRENDFNQTERPHVRLRAYYVAFYLPCAARVFKWFEPTTYKETDGPEMQRRDLHTGKNVNAQHTYLRLHAFYFIKKVLCARRGCIKGLCMHVSFLCVRGKKGREEGARGGLFLSNPYRTR